MNYEKALELKNAGFPQMSIDTGKYICVHGGHEVGTRDCEDYVYIPTLEELIGSIDIFDYLVKVNNSNEWKCDSHKRNGSSDGIYGSTPSEAVANLWLALNTK